MTEQELAKCCARGDRGAQEELYARTSQRIYRLGLKMTGRCEDAFDLVQETYLRAFERMSQFDGRSSLSTWLYRIAVNEALQFRRRAERARVKLQSLAVKHNGTSDTDRTTMEMDVGAALEALGPTDRVMLLLRYQEGLDYRTIAEVTGYAEGTVGSRLNRARDRMRELLEKGYGWREETDASGHPKEGKTDAPDVCADRSGPQAVSE